MKSCCEKMLDLLSSCVLTKVEDETSSSSKEKIAQVASGSIPRSHSMERTNYVVPEAIHGSQSCPDFSKDVRSSSTDSFINLSTSSKEEIRKILNDSHQELKNSENLKKRDPALYRLRYLKPINLQNLPDRESPIISSPDVNKYGEIFEGSPSFNRSKSTEDDRRESKKD